MKYRTDIPHIINLPMNKIIIIGLLTLLCFSKDDPKYDTLYQEPNSLGDSYVNAQQMHLFDQVIDHYDYSSQKTFKQRYWVLQDFYKTSSKGPIFIYLCGQWVCSGIPSTRTWVGALAERLNGMVVVLQHRFYGDSLPFGNQSFTLANMKLLNSEQALRDAAYFIQVLKTQNLYNVKDNPWIVVGGSYPGALSAWFRYKYPHLVIGSLASSAVVLAVEDFKDFDQQIYLATALSGDFCSQALNASNHKVQSILYLNEISALQFKSRFPGGQKLSNKEFLFFWADTNVLTVQYGGRTSICNKLKDKTSDEQFQILVTNAQNYQVYQYSSYWLRNQTMTFLTKSAARPWYYQYCTEYGFFQTFSDRHPMRSFKMDLDFFREFCSDAFGPGTWAKVDRKNIEYGGLQLKGSNIIFTNGVQDPWRWASLQKSENPDILARVIDCPNCAHCVDLSTPKPQDSDELKKARDLTFAEIQNWINRYSLSQNKNEDLISNLQTY